EVRRRQAEFADARERLARTTVRAPFAGQVTRRHARPGERVSPGSSLIDLVDLSRLRFEATALETQVAHLRRGQRVEVVVPAVSAHALPGRIAGLIAASEPTKQAYTVQVELELTSGSGPPAGLHPGMSGTARFVLPARPSAPTGRFAV